MFSLTAVAFFYLLPYATNSRRVLFSCFGETRPDYLFPRSVLVPPPTVIPQTRPQVPLMAKRLEDSLYRNAKSFKAYKDQSTLRHRLQQLAARLGTNAQQNRAKVSLSFPFPSYSSGDAVLAVVPVRSVRRISFASIVSGILSVSVFFLCVGVRLSVGTGLCHQRW